MADNHIVINIPPMPNPRDYGLDGNMNSESSAAGRFEAALKAWERAVKAIAEGVKSN